MAQHNNLGSQGEEAAIHYLIEKGYTIREKNWRHGKYEVDIIATDTENLIFVEVKTRTSERWGNPEEAVTKAKIRRIVDSADRYTEMYDIDLPIRFDVIAVIWNGTSFDIKHFDDAFLAPLN